MQAAVESFYAAGADGDFAQYCSLLTPAARDRVRVNAARLLEEAGQLRCEEILAVAEEQFKGLGIRVREVSVSGIQARVEVNVKVALVALVTSSGPLVMLVSGGVVSTGSASRLPPSNERILTCGPPKTDAAMPG